MTPKWPSRVNLSTLVSNLEPGSDLGLDKKKDQYALYILSHQNSKKSNSPFLSNLYSNSSFWLDKRYENPKT